MNSSVNTETIVDVSSANGMNLQVIEAAIPFTNHWPYGR